MGGISYAGDVTSQEAWDILRQQSDAVLVDCRTDVEWTFIGLPELAALNKRPLLIAWQAYPEMRVNENFVQEVQAKGVKPDQTVLLICRSGQRSKLAAMALTAAGYSRCYNVSDGFEGAHDERRHRGQVEGWKVAGLPWTQS
jgi:rhodanese-related sulfurtransferase